MSQKLTAIRISDPYVVGLVEAEQSKTGEGTATKTAARLIIERLTLRERMTDAHPAPEQQAGDTRSGESASAARA